MMLCGWRARAAAAGPRSLRPAFLLGSPSESLQASYLSSASLMLAMNVSLAMDQRLPFSACV